MFYPRDWAQRLTFSKQTEEFYLTEEAEPDRFNRPADARYVSIGIYGTSLPHEFEPHPVFDLQRNIYWYPRGLFGVASQARVETLSWREKCGGPGVMIGRFQGFNMFQGVRETLIDTTPYKILSEKPKKHI